MQIFDKRRCLNIHVHVYNILMILVSSSINIKDLSMYFIVKKTLLFGIVTSDDF